MDASNSIRHLVEDLARPIYNWRMAVSMVNDRVPRLRKSARTRERHAKVALEYYVRAWVRDHPEPSEDFKKAWPNWPEEDGRIDDPQPASSGS